MADDRHDPTDPKRDPTDPKHDPIDPKHELPWPEESKPENVGAQFADPNSGDDRRLGREFAETNSSKKHEQPPLKERIHWPENRRPLYWFLIAFFILVVIVFLAGWLPRHARDEDTARRSKEEKNAKPMVETMKVVAPKDEAGLAVPGTTIPLTEAYVYARANGYLQKRYADIGDHVKKGQLLAVIDAPDLDAQVAQARQQVFQAERQLDQQESQLALATVTVKRYRVLVAKGVFSRQDGDTQEANYASAVANVEAAHRNVDAYKSNLEHEIALQSYERVTAPFAGVITERNVDVGALISAAGATSGGGASAPQGQNSTAGGTTQAGASNNQGSSGNGPTLGVSAQSPGQGGPLFGIAQTQRLRILVSVPEGYAPVIHVGLKAPVTVQEYQGEPLFAQVTRTSDSIDPNTRTMLTELQIDNTAGKLISGMYVVVTFPPVTGGGGSPLVITGDAIAIRKNTSQVATVVNGKIHWVPVTIGRDYGNETEIMTGLKTGDLIVTDVTDDVVEGAAVETQMAPGAEAQQGAAPKQDVPLGGSTQYGNANITDQNLQGKQGQQNQKGQGKQQGPSKQKGSESKQ
jgi:multidrug efflux pump subunit AcrA (membrane-fusion protein)